MSCLIWFLKRWQIIGSALIVIPPGTYKFSKALCAISCFMVIIFMNLKRRYLTHFTLDPKKGWCPQDQGILPLLSPKLQIPLSYNVENSN